MSTYTLISQAIDVLYTICLYGLISFVTIKLMIQIPTWWADSDPRKQASAVAITTPQQQPEVPAVEEVKPQLEIEMSETSQHQAEIEVVEVSEKPQTQSLTKVQQQIDVLALKIYKLHNHQVVKVEAVESQGITIPLTIKRYAYRKVPNAVVRLKDLESAELVNGID